MLRWNELDTWNTMCVFGYLMLTHASGLDDIQNVYPPKQLCSFRFRVVRVRDSHVINIALLERR